MTSKKAIVKGFINNGELCSRLKVFNGVFRKLYEDLIEAYLRTPQVVSSKPYIERALRLVQAGLTLSIEFLRQCSEVSCDEGNC